MSGLKASGCYRFMTLTSKLGYRDDPVSCQRDWRVLIGRLVRRGLVQGYIRVGELTERGAVHYHLIWRGGYIEFVVLKKMWIEIHGASHVYLEKVRGGKRGLCNYLVKYCAKEGATRLAWSWGWVFRGFARCWRCLKRHFSPESDYLQRLLSAWGFLIIAKRSGVEAFKACLICGELPCEERGHFDSYPGGLIHV